MAESSSQLPKQEGDQDHGVKAKNNGREELIRARFALTMTWVVDVKWSFDTMSDDYSGPGGGYLSFELLIRRIG
jgi:hypothetical protein